MWLLLKLKNIGMTPLILSFVFVSLTLREIKEQRVFCLTFYPPSIFPCHLWHLTFSTLPLRSMNRDLSQAEPFRSSGSMWTQRGFFPFYFTLDAPHDAPRVRGCSCSLWAVKGGRQLSPKHSTCAEPHTKPGPHSSLPAYKCYSLIFLASYHIFRMALNTNQIKTGRCFGSDVFPLDCNLGLSWVIPCTSCLD